MTTHEYENTRLQPHAHIFEKRRWRAVLALGEIHFLRSDIPEDISAWGREWLFFNVEIFYSLRMMKAVRVNKCSKYSIMLLWHQGCIWISKFNSINHQHRNNQKGGDLCLRNWQHFWPGRR